MTAFLVFAQTDPVLIMTSRTAVSDGRLLEGLTTKGIDKFIAYEVPLDGLRRKYGVSFEVIESDVKNGKDVAVLDSKGSHVFANVPFSDLGESFRHDPEPLH